MKRHAALRTPVLKLRQTILSDRAEKREMLARERLSQTSYIDRTNYITRHQRERNFTTCGSSSSSGARDNIISESVFVPCSPRDSPTRCDLESFARQTNKKKRKNATRPADSRVCGQRTRKLRRRGCYRRRTAWSYPRSFLWRTICPTSPHSQSAPLCRPDRIIPLLLGKFNLPFYTHHV